MSLINQMLQDLEARGKQGQTVTPMPSEVRPVLPPQRTNHMWLMVLCLALLLLVLVLWMVPRQLGGPPHALVANPPAVAAGAAPGVAATAPQGPARAAPQRVSPAVQPRQQGASTATSEAVLPAAVAPAADVAAVASAPGAPAAALASASAAPAAVVLPGKGGADRARADRLPLNLKLIPELTSLTRPERQNPPRSSAAEPAFVDVVTPGQGKPATEAAPREPAARNRNAREGVAGGRHAAGRNAPALAIPAGVAGASAAATSATAAATPAGDNSIRLIRQPLSPQQRAENEYRKAMQAQQQGRLPEAMAYLEQALQFDHQHTASRQAMVAWLLEQGQRPQAILKLQEGLAHDPAQSALAMILARLQVDQGDVKPALETLNRSLPYTLGRADYQAFMAALLQREGRHKEAILRYQNALAINPDNAVWWMGIGISLQAEQQKAAARDAFGRARGNGGLSPELQAFVEQRISQLQ